MMQHHGPESYDVAVSKAAAHFKTKLEEQKRVREHAARIYHRESRTNYRKPRTQHEDGHPSRTVGPLATYA